MANPNKVSTPSVSEDYTYRIDKELENFFDSLFDRSENPNIDRRYMKISTPESKEDSLALQLLQAKMIPYPEQSYKIPHFSEKEESFVPYVPGIEGNRTVLYPNTSSLTKKEQLALFRFHCKTYYKIKPLNTSEADEFKELLNKAHKDYPAFQEFVESQWIKHQCKRSLEIPPDVLSHTDRLWNMRAGQCLDLYPKQYKSISEIPLALNDPNEAWAVMDNPKSIIKRGTAPRMTLPSLKKRCALVTEFNKLHQIKQVEVDKKLVTVKPVCHQNLPASLDPSVDFCLDRENNIDVIITSSGIKTIVDIDKFQKDWYLPVTVKTLLQSDCESTKKIVIVDKKLPPQYMSTHDKNMWHAKIFSKWALILNDNPNLFEMNQQTSKSKIQATEERKITEYDDLVSEDYDIFGVNPEPGRSTENDCKPIENKFKNPSKISKLGAKLEDSEIFDISQFLESTKSIPELSAEKKEKRTLPHTQTVQQGKEHSNFIGTPKSKIINPCNEYRIWQLHKSKHFNMMKHEQRTLNVLVRTRIDGRLFYYRNNFRVMDEVYVSSKLEFQPEYGASRMDNSELVREYIDLYLRPNCKLVRVRTVGHTKELMLNEVRTIHDIRECLQAKRTQKMFDSLYAVLTKLIDLPVGKYLLHHSAKMGAFAQLMVEHPNGTSFNMSHYCYELRQADTSVPPAQVDPFVLTKIHHRERMPPALFHPKFVSKSVFLKKLTFTPRKKRKQKKKQPPK